MIRVEVSDIWQGRGAGIRVCLWFSWVEVEKRVMSEEIKVMVSKVDWLKRLGQGFNVLLRYLQKLKVVYGQKNDFVVLFSLDWRVWKLEGSFFSDLVESGEYLIQWGLLERRVVEENDVKLRFYLFYQDVVINDKCGSLFSFFFKFVFIINLRR